MWPRVTKLHTHTSGRIKDNSRFDLRILPAAPLVAEDDLVAPPVQNGYVHAGADGQQVLLDSRPHLFLDRNPVCHFCFLLLIRNKICDCKGTVEEEEI